MAREISPICDFIFGSIRTCLPTYKVEVDLTVRTVKGIYTYKKDHTSESTTFTPWSKKVILFPSLRWKIQAFKNDKRQNMTKPWNDGNNVQFSAPPKMLRNLRKHTSGKIRTRWSGRNWFNPIKVRRPNTPDTKVSDLNKTDIVVPIPRKACDNFGLSCSYCKQGVLHPSPQEFDWPSKDRDGTKAKAREQNKSLIDFNDPKPQTNMEQTTDIDKVGFSKLQIGQDDLKEEPLVVARLLIPQPTVTEPLEQVIENTNGEGLLEVEKRLQREEEHHELYNRIYMGQLSDEEDSSTDTDDSHYTYFG